MKPLSNALKKMLNGLASADAGEYLSRRQKNSFLQGDTRIFGNSAKPAPKPLEIVAKTSKRRHVAMYLGNELPSKMMDYVIDTCSSLDHDLTVVTFESGMVSSALLEPYTTRMQDSGIEMNIARLSGEPVKSLARYLRNHPEIAFLACKDSGYLGRNYMNGTQLENALPVPVVVVVTSPATAAAQPAEQTEKAATSGTA